MAYASKQEKSQQVGTMRPSLLRECELVETALADQKSITVRSSDSTALAMLVPPHLCCPDDAGAWPGLEGAGEAVTADNEP